MKDSDYSKLIELTNVGGGFIPYNENAVELLDRCAKGEVITVREVTQRDLAFHRCYMLLLSFIWGYMPKVFKESVPKDLFYKWLKHFKKEYDVEFTFKDGSQLIEYTSISFGRMGQKEFEKYIAEQLPYIYENVLGAYFEGDILNSIVNTIEEEFKKMLSKLP
jgi:hypothetical protein